VEKTPGRPGYSILDVLVCLKVVDDVVCMRVVDVVVCMRVVDVVVCMRVVEVVVCMKVVDVVVCMNVVEDVEVDVCGSIQGASTPGPHVAEYSFVQHCGTGCPARMAALIGAKL
jgi:hypothetical protein